MGAQTPQRICPRCGARAPLLAEQCGRCGRRYRTQFNQPSEAAPDQPPPAIKPAEHAPVYARTPTSTLGCACPACHSQRVVSGRLTGNDWEAVFTPDNTRFRLITAASDYRSVHLTGKATICVACGFLWSRVDAAEARRKIHAHGTDALKARVLDPVDALPRPGHAPLPESENLPYPAATPAAPLLPNADVRTSALDDDKGT